MGILLLLSLCGINCVNQLHKGRGFLMSNLSYRKVRKLLGESIARHEKWMEAEEARAAIKAAEYEKRREEEEARAAIKAAEYEKRREEEEARAAIEAAEYKKKMEEYEKKMEEEKKQSKKEWKKLRSDLGRIGISQGEQVEAMFVNLDKRFNKLGFSFPKESGRTLFRENGRVVVEVDRFLENGTAVMSVEVKAKLRMDYVKFHIERLGKLSQYLKKNNDNRIVLGAVAGGIIPDNVLDYAHRMGLYVLVQSGESITLATAPDGFKHREW